MRTAPQLERLIAKVGKQNFALSTGEFSFDVEKAARFESSRAAKAFCEKHDLTGVEMVLRVDNTPRLDMRFPLR